MFSSLSVCLFVYLSVSNFAQKLPNWFAWNFQGSLAMGHYTKVKFLWRSGSPSGYTDCFPDSSLLGDTESGISRLRCATLQCRAGIAIATRPITLLRHRPLTEVYTVPVLLLLHFAWVVDDAKCASVCVCASVCLSVRGRMPTLLHGPGCNLEEWWVMPL